MDGVPLILWLRRDFRLADNPLWAEAAATGRPVVPVFILDPETEVLGAAPKWRLGLAVEAFSRTLDGMGLRLVLRRGPAADSLLQLVRDTGARDVWWGRAYDPDSIARDTGVKTALKAAGIGARSLPGQLIWQPWEVATGAGTPYRVFTPFLKAVRAMGAPAALPAPAHLGAPQDWPPSDRLEDWALGRAMNRGAAIVAPHLAVGEAAALHRLDEFLDDRVDDYADRRDLLAEPATSGLSENLAWGEIGPRLIWQRALRRLDEGARGAGSFLTELVWREFAWHLMFHFPAMARQNWRDDWNAFPWRGDSRDAERWRRGMTGEPVVDAAMRELYVTGRMHNRARMIVASYLTKHLLTDWRIGLDWFADCLVDWDPAANAMGWQWVAGSGPDAAPFFRIFNPATQAAKFDPAGLYRARYLAEGRRDPAPLARAFFDAVPKSWAVTPDQPPPAPLIGLAEGRARALSAYETARRLSGA